MKIIQFLQIIVLIDFEILLGGLPDSTMSNKTKITAYENDAIEATWTKEITFK